MLDRLIHEQHSFFHKAEERIRRAVDACPLPKAVLAPARPRRAEPDPQDLAQIIREYGPGDTEEGKELRRSLAITRGLIRLYGGLPEG
jgi:hypothetical protein